MNQMPVLPKILQPDQLKALNEHLVKTTGCFAFLKTGQVLFSLSPQSWQDAYTIFSVGLYSVYHDYGCKFLPLLLDDELCPDSLPEPNRHRIHIETVNRHIRTNLTHGLLDSCQRIQLQRKMARYYLCGSNYTANPEVWPDFINHLNEDHWMQITQQLVRDSNNLYTYLSDWGDAWAELPGQLSELQRKFASYNSSFSLSFDDRICRPLLLSNCVIPSDISMYTGKGSPNIKSWRKTLVNAYQDGMTHPEALYNELKLLIRKDVQHPQNSSVGIAENFGFCAE